MKKITRTIKGFEINYVEVDTNTMSMERKTEYSDTPITESAFNKLVKERGKLAADIEIKPYNNGMIEMSIAQFYGMGKVIEKKSDIKGRSITKEIKVQSAPCVVATKVDNEWKITTHILNMFDGDFNTADYNIDGFYHVLEVGEWSEEKTYLIGIEEWLFAEYGQKVVK